MLMSACLCRLGGVFHVEGNPQSTEALVRACADTAATALVLLPWSWQTAGSDADDVVTAGMVDAGVLSVVRRLRALNPHVQVGEGHTQQPAAWVEANTRHNQLLHS
jgi:hypothetical protein